jgi:membrane-associated phospholipid phosphatase
MRYLYIYIFILIGIFSTKIEAQTVEVKWLHSINTESSPFFNHSSSFLSNSTPYLAVGLPLALLADGYISGNENTIKNGWYVASTLAVSSILTMAMKYGINRNRPYVTYPGYIIPHGSDGSPSFPSGHTSMAFSVATSLSICYPKWYVIAPSMLWATSVGYSRMNLGVHYPSDVVAGAVLGAGSAWLTIKFNKWMNKPIERVTKQTMDWTR